MPCFTEQTQTRKLSQKKPDIRLHGPSDQHLSRVAPTIEWYVQQGLALQATKLTTQPLFHSRDVLSHH